MLNRSMVCILCLHINKSCDGVSHHSYFGFSIFKAHGRGRGADMICDQAFWELGDLKYLKVAMDAVLVICDQHILILGDW